MMNIGLIKLCCCCLKEVVFCHSYSLDYHFSKYLLGSLILLFMFYLGNRLQVDLIADLLGHSRTSLAASKCWCLLY